VSRLIPVVSACAAALPLVVLGPATQAVPAGGPVARSAATILLPEDDPFYRVPASAADRPNGAVLASRRVDARAFELPLPVTAWQVKYRTEDSHGRASASVTTVLVPNQAWTGPGPRPLLSYQTAEDGVTGRCAPSYALRAGISGGFTGSYSETTLIAMALGRGWTVTVPDYEGPRSEFLVAGTQAKGVLDAIRATRRFAPAGVARRAKVGVWGYSGGSLASVTAAQLQPSYAPHLRLDALALGGLLGDVRSTIDAFSGSIGGGAIPMGINGFLRAYPGLHLMQYLNESGQTKVRETAHACLFDAAPRYPFLRLSDIEAVPDALSLPPVAAMLRANSPRTLRGVPRVPIYHYHATNDEFAPIGPARDTLRRFCRAGVVVESVEKPLGEHLTEIALGAPGALDFLAARFAGRAPRNTCAAIPVSARQLLRTETAARTWYVSAAATSTGVGTAARPFRTLAAVERASRAGDTIVVLPAGRALDRGIQLKPGQRLIGAGPAVTTLGPAASAPRLTNSTTAHLAGDAVRLADGVTVRNLRITRAQRGAVYGAEVSGVSVVGNDVSGQNASCAPGFLIPQFNAPTNVPGVGAPIVGGLQNGWAGIMVDAARRTNGTVRISGNAVHDAECGDGIDVRTSGTAAYVVTITGNRVTRLRQGATLKSVLAIGLQARDQSSLTGSVLGNRQAALGNPDDLNLGPEGADSEGVFVNGVGPSTMQVTVERNAYTNAGGVGGFSANGFEMVTMGDGARVSVAVRDSHFSGSPGDVIEEGALGTSARMDLVLEGVVAERSTGVGNTWVLPFNNGDCVLAGSLGAGNDVRLTVRDTVLRDCADNGLSVGSNVVNGQGSTRNISLDVDHSVLTGNRGGNLGIRNFTALDSLSVKVQHSDLAGSGSLGSAVADLAVEDLGSTATSTIDLGGGPLASAGGNCLRGGLLAADVVGYGVSARHDWWGQPGGAGPLRTLALGGWLDTTEPASSAPPWCG
jgi:hypothetical protein